MPGTVNESEGGEPLQDPFEYFNDYSLLYDEYKKMIQVNGQK